ncbi:MAG: metallophosphoesterase, partial [Verrucomicrobiota bacterium]
WNDTHVNNQTIRQLDRATPEADFLLWNGDTCNDWTAEDLLVPTLLCPGGCDVTHGRPLFLVWGNHDVRGKYAFQVPALVTTPTHRPFYAFRCGPVAVICLHTGEDKPDGHPSFGGRVAFDSLRQEQAAWLAETIARPEISGAAYRIVFCHIPLRWLDETPPDYAKAGFDHYSRRSREAWHHALVRWQAQVVISGHTHHDAWLPASADFPYGQLVGGGPQPNSATWIEANAGPDGLHLQMHDLEGKIRHEVRLGPIT